jgi:antitoxin (DNA-binding transcriptional repressor) of toxin-antitoxin stability system
MEALSITRDIVYHMPDVTIRELRNEGGDVVDRASRGERITITRSGRPVAELRALPTPASPLSAEALIERWGRLPEIDPVALRADVDEILDSSL